MGPKSNAGEIRIRTGLSDPIAIGLARSLLDEARLPYFVLDDTTSARRDIESLAWWTILVPADREAEAREILESVESRK